MYKVNGPLSFPARRKLRELDFRAPEDSLFVDEGDEAEIRSPGIERMIKAYYDADHADDDSERATALRGLIDEMTALHKLRGVPVFAHPPLPPQFVAAQADGAKYAGGSDVISKITNLIEPNNRPAVKMQLEGAVGGRRVPLADVSFSLASESVGGNGSSQRWSNALDLSGGNLPNADAGPRRGGSPDDQRLSARAVSSRTQSAPPNGDGPSRCEQERQKMAELKQELDFARDHQRQLAQEMVLLDDQIRDLRMKRDQLAARVQSLGPTHDRSPKSAELARLGDEIRTIDRKLRALEARRALVSDWLRQGNDLIRDFEWALDRATYNATRYCENYT
jgi:hypothetical protein